MYSEQVNVMIAMAEGLRIIIAVHEKRYAGIGPKASYKYGYSPPDFGINVPSSAKDRAPVINMKILKIQCGIFPHIFFQNHN